MPNLYSVQFEVLPTDGSTSSDLFVALQERISDWIVEKYARAWNVEVVFPAPSKVCEPLSRHAIRYTLAEVETGAVQRMTWVHPDDKDSSLRWTTLLTIARSADKVQFAIQVGVTSSSYVVRPAMLTLGRPRIVTKILNECSCWVGAFPLLTKPLHIEPADVASFVQGQLVNPERSIPFVVVSHDRFSDRPVMDPERIQRRLLGFGQVAELDKWAAFRLTECLGKSLSCYHGCIRVYWPGLTQKADPLQHPLHFPAKIERFENIGRPWDQWLFDLLARISTFRYADGEVISQVQRALNERAHADAERRRQQIEEGRMAASSLHDVQELLDLADDENRRLTARLSEIEKEKEDLAAELQAVKGNFSIYQQYQTGDENETPVESGVEPLEFASVEAALEGAERDFGEELRVLEEALRSAQDSDFARPDEVYQALMAIRDVGVLYFKSIANGTPMGTWGEQLAKRGFTQYSQSESTTVKNDYKRYRRFREFKIGGKKRPIYQHLDLGGGDRKNCLQIYFEPDKPTKKVIIAHCGEHLPFPRQRT